MLGQSDPGLLGRPCSCRGCREQPGPGGATTELLWLLRHLGVCAVGLDLAGVTLKPDLVVPFADTTVLAASEDEIISSFFPVADLHDGQDLRRAAHVRRPLGQLPLLPGGL